MEFDYKLERVPSIYLPRPDDTTSTDINSPTLFVPNDNPSGAQMTLQIQILTPPEETVPHRLK